MKKIICIDLLLISTLAFAQIEEAPAPFQYIKEYACGMAEMDSDGHYICIFDIEEKESQYQIAIGYFPKYKVIGIGMAGYGYFLYFENDKTFGVTISDYIMPINEIIAINSAYKIYRELVKRNLLKRKI